MDKEGDPTAEASREQMLAALRQLARVARDGVVPEDLDDDALLRLLADAETVGRLADGLRVLGAGVVAERSRPELGEDRLSARRGCRNASELVERATRVSGATARRRIRAADPLRIPVGLTGERLPARFPLVRHGVASGSLSLDAAETIVRALAPALDHGAAHMDVAAGEAALVGAATGCDAEALLRGEAARPDPGLAHTADDVAVMANAWALALDPDGALPDETTGLRRRTLTLGRERNGTVPLRAELLPDVAAQFQRLVDAYLNPRVGVGPPGDDRPADGTAGNEGGRHAAGAGVPETPDSTCLPELPVAPDTADHRSPGQRRHDALAGILTVAAGHADTPHLGGSAPTLVVTTTVEDLADPRGIAFLEGAPDPTGAAVGSHVARHVACSGAVQKVLLGPGGAILALTTTQRTFTAHQRRAIALRDGECVIPGCHVPATWCEVHHVHEHAAGGPTDTSNGVLLCWHHHRTLETSGWRIRMRGGLPWVRPPTWVDPSARWMSAAPTAAVHRRTRRELTRTRNVPRRQ